MAYTLAALAYRGIRSAEERRAFDEMLAEFRSAFAAHARDEWTWFEPRLTYSNALLPWGLLAAYEVTGDREIRDIALASLDFLIRTMTDARRGIVRPVGNRGWGEPGKIARFDQQPVDVWKLAMAAEKAYALTRNPSTGRRLRARRPGSRGPTTSASPSSTKRKAPLTTASRRPDPTKTPARRRRSPTS